MGESDAQRVELLLQLQELGPTEVPVNFLNPRPGTPFADRPMVGAWEAIRWIAMFRLALPGVILRYAGGREVTLRDLQAMGMTSGINALIVGKLSHHPRPVDRRGHGHAGRPAHAGGCPHRRPLRCRHQPSASAVDTRFRSARDAGARSTHRGSGPTCGRRMTVAVTRAASGPPVAITAGSPCRSRLPTHAGVGCPSSLSPSVRVTSRHPWEA